MHLLCAKSGTETKHSGWMEIWFVLTRNTLSSHSCAQCTDVTLVVNLTCRSYGDLQKQPSIASSPFNMHAVCGHVGCVQLLTQQATETPGRKITST